MLLLFPAETYILPFHPADLTKFKLLVLNDRRLLHKLVRILIRMNSQTVLTKVIQSWPYLILLRAIRSSTSKTLILPTSRNNLVNALDMPIEVVGGAETSLTMVAFVYSFPGRSLVWSGSMKHVNMQSSVSRQHSSRLTSYDIQSGGEYQTYIQE